MGCRAGSYFSGTPPPQLGVAHWENPVVRTIQGTASPPEVATRWGGAHNAAHGTGWTAATFLHVVDRPRSLRGWSS
jgi:hypothetical protein